MADKVVTVPGVGVVSFPDSMSDDQIADVIKKQNPGLSQPPKKGLLDQAEDFGKSLWEQINPVSALKGAAQSVSHPIQTLKADVNAREDVLQKAHEAFQKGKYTEGAAHWLYAHIPLMGSSLDNAGEQFMQGNYGAGAGASVGMGLTLAAPEAIKGANLRLPNAAGAAERMYQSALKPSTTLSATERANVVRTGLNSQIPISAQGADKLSGLISDLNNKIKANIKAGAQSGATIDPAAVATRADQVTGRFTKQVNPTGDLQAIQASKNEFLSNNPNPIPVDEAQAMKQGTYQQLKGRAYGELRSATVEAQKALARGIKEELEQQFPEIKGLNAQEAKLINLDGELERAINRIGNHQLIGIGTPIAAGAAGAVVGHPGSAALAAGGLKAVLDNPMVKSKLAIALNKAGRGAIPMSTATARVTQFMNAIAQSQRASATSESAQAQ